MTKITVGDVLGKLDEFNGNIRAVADSLSVARSTVYRKINKSKTLQAALKDSRESMKDNVESVLYNEALNGNMTAVIFYLKTQAKDRGYVERQEVAGVDGQELGVKLKREIDKVFGDVESD